MPVVWIPSQPLTNFRSTTETHDDEGGRQSWTTTWWRGRRRVVQWRVRWDRADTVELDEQIDEGAGGALIWRPMPAARAFAHGGGERPGPMVRLMPMDYLHDGGDPRLGTLGHLSYFNQWQLAWVAFTADDDSDSPCVGLFTGWGADWRNRGLNRIEVRRDEQGDFLRLPLHPGRRRWALVFGTRAALAVDASDRRCLPNRRKASCSDLRPAKTAGWQLDPPLPPRRLNLLRDDDLDGMHQRLAQEPAVTSALDTCLHQAGPGDLIHFAAAWWKQDRAGLAASVAEMVDWARRTDADIADGGYERLIIFDGRHAKRRAYDLDVMWGRGLIDEDRYRVVRGVMLKLAYMFSDGDYCRYEDFWLDEADSDDAALARAMAPEMGRTPVPPNFAAENFSTVGVVAELFPDHPMATTWRAWTLRQLDRYLDRFFEPDGTYHESINYHNHTWNMLSCLLWPLWHKGVRDCFADPRLRGSLEHFLAVTTPATDCVTSMEKVMRHGPSAAALWAQPRSPRRAYLNNGNSGGDWCMQSPRGELTLGMAVYRDADPALAGSLAWLWRESGMLVLDGERPMLTLATLDPTVSAAAPALVSQHRRSLGVISRSDACGESLVLFRAGRATNHMDFDQGAVQWLAFGKALLGDPGYHAVLPDGTRPHGAATRWHSTVLYSHDLDDSAGYTGLEQAPEPIHVAIGADRDTCLHRIVNTNCRRLDTHSYRETLPAGTVTHTRRYLFLKQPGLIVLEDRVEPADHPCLFLLQPAGRLQPTGPGRFSADCGDGVFMDVTFLHPAAPVIVHAQHLGPCWTFAFRGDDRGRFLAVLTARQGEPAAEVTADDRGIHIVRSRAAPVHVCGVTP